MEKITMSMRELSAQIAEELNAVYDQSKSLPGYDRRQLYSAEELIAKLSRQ